MYRFKKNVLEEGESRKYILFQNEEPLRYENFLSLLQKETAFRSFFIELLSEEIPFDAYQWETPPVTLSTVGRQFEFVIHNSPGIDLPPDPGPFRSYFRDLPEGESIAAFDNLGGDARLIAPAPVRQGLNYSHIGAFIKSAPIEQQQALWQKTGRLTEELLSERPLWLNTAGGGVAWLHIRLDTRPKYYRHRPYAEDMLPG